MKNTFLIHKAFILFALLSLVLYPLSTTNAESRVNAGVTASVVQQRSDNITINSITAVKTSGFADGTFDNGWKWTFDITIPNVNETRLTMRFSDWTSLGSGNFTMPVANNLKFYSEQSSNALKSNSAILISGADVESSGMILVGNLNASNSGTRRIRITTETKIPPGSNIGMYSTNFAVRTSLLAII